MKRNILKRVSTAVVLAAAVALLPGCGSSGSSTAVTSTGIGTYGIVTYGTATGLSLSFTGIAVMDSLGNVYSGGNYGQLQVSATTSAPEGGFSYGRINTTDGSILEFNLTPISSAEFEIQGYYIMGSDVATLWQASGGSLSSFILYQMGSEAMTQAASVIGSQPFTNAIVSGELLLNGTAVPY